MANDNTTSNRVLDGITHAGDNVKVADVSASDASIETVKQETDHYTSQGISSVKNEIQDGIAQTTNINSNDFVIRDGFPALRLPGSSDWNVEDEEPIPNHSFRVEPSLLSFSKPTSDSKPIGDDESSSVEATTTNTSPWESIWEDAMTVFTARTRDDSAAYSAGTTYFCPAQMKPRCALEELVLSIYNMHTKHLEPGVIIPEQSGAEWWTLVMDQTCQDVQNKGNNNEDDDDDEEDDDEVGMHFDADYGLEDQAPNLMLHPRLATVTYLTSVGAPTLILDQRSPPPADVEKKTLQGSIRKGWLSHPRQGKHISFDGRLLHGAPSTFFPPVKKNSKDNTNSENGWGWSEDDDERPAKKVKLSAESVQNETLPQQKRITFLVNIWINHCPLDAEPLEDEIVEQLGAKGEISMSWIGTDDNTTPGTVELPIVSLQAAKPTSPNSFAALSNRNNHDEVEAAGEEEVVIGGRLINISYGASMEAFKSASEMAASSHLGCIELELGREVIALSVGEVVDENDDHSDES
jgi:hypothetical protein